MAFFYEGHETATLPLEVETLQVNPVRFQSAALRLPFSVGDYKTRNPLNWSGPKDIGEMKTPLPTRDRWEQDIVTSHRRTRKLLRYRLAQVEDEVPATLVIHGKHSYSNNGKVDTFLNEMARIGMQTGRVSIEGLHQSMRQGLVGPLNRMKDPVRVLNLVFAKDSKWQEAATLVDTGRKNDESAGKPLVLMLSYEHEDKMGVPKLQETGVQRVVEKVIEIGIAESVDLYLWIDCQFSLSGGKWSKEVVSNYSLFPGIIYVRKESPNARVNRMWLAVERDLLSSGSGFYPCGDGWDSAVGLPNWFKVDKGQAKYIPGAMNYRHSVRNSVCSGVYHFAETFVPEEKSWLRETAISEVDFRMRKVGEVSDIYNVDMFTILDELVLSQAQTLWRVAADASFHGSHEWMMDDGTLRFAAQCKSLYGGFSVAFSVLENPKEKFVALFTFEDAWLGILLLNVEENDPQKFRVRKYRRLTANEQGILRTRDSDVQLGKLKLLIEVTYDCGLQPVYLTRGTQLM